MELLEINIVNLKFRKFELTGRICKGEVFRCQIGARNMIITK